MSVLDVLFFLLLAWGRLADSTIVLGLAAMASLRPSFSQVSVWMVGGALLLVSGWIGLSWSSRRPSEGAVRAPGSTVGRIAGGAGLGIVGGLAGLFLLSLGTTLVLSNAAVSIHWGPETVGALLPLAVVGGFAGWLSSGGRWSASGLNTWLGLCALSVGFVGYGSLVVLAATSSFGLLIGYALVILESFGLALMLAYQFYALEWVAGRGPAFPAPLPLPWEECPRVAVQVPSYNEPVDVVERSLDSLLRLDYPRDRLTIQLLDDSTDPQTREELGRYCSDRGVAYVHRAQRRGFKAGALNDGLAQLPMDVDFLAIVDSDYVVDPAFLREVLRPFKDPQVAFVQTPQAYRNGAASPFARKYALADAYFYHVVQPVRARRQSAIFCGTMGAVRRRALEGAGGWSEACVTEDAELSVRLISSGWQLRYLPRTYGRGLAPVSMDGVRSQHRRWAYGGMQMLRMNRRRLESDRVSRRQWTDFWVGGMFWTDGIFFLGMAGVLAALAVGSWTGESLPSPAATALAFAAAAPTLLLWDGLLKIRLAIRRNALVSYSEVVGVLSFWYSVKINDLRAALRGFVGERLPFARTPKTMPSRPTRRQALAAALRATWLEVTLALGLVAVIGVTAWRWLALGSAAGVIPALSLAGWLVYYALGLAAAPITDYGSRRHPAAIVDLLPTPARSPVEDRTIG